MVKIFLDDERSPPNDGGWWIVARSFEEFKDVIDWLHLPPDFISFDHDLGQGKNGLDCAKYIVEVWGYVWNGKYYVHSQNPVGKANIEGYIDGWFKFINEQADQHPDW